jgi:hypothetical protein
MSDVRVFNDQLLLVLRAGVPLAIGNLTTASQIESFVANVNDRFPSTDSATVSVDERIANDALLPLDYRKAFQAWKRGDRTAQAIHALFETACAESDMRWSITKLLLPLLLVVWLVAQGMTFLVGRMYPELKAVYEVSNRNTSASLQFLEFLNANARIGTVCLTLLMVLIVVLWLRVPAWLVRLVPTHGLTIQSLRRAQQFEREVRHSRTAMSKPAGQVALLFSTDAELRSKEIRAALCRADSAFASRQWLRWFPMIMGTFLSGLLVFGYVFCMFWPIVDLLQQLSMP